MTVEWAKLVEMLPPLEPYYPRVHCRIVNEQRLLILKWRTLRDLEDFDRWIETYQRSWEVKNLTRDDVIKSRHYHVRQHPFGDVDRFFAVHSSIRLWWPKADGTALHWRIPDRHLHFARGYVLSEDNDFPRFLQALSDAREQSAEYGNRTFRHREMDVDANELGRWWISCDKEDRFDNEDRFYLDVDHNPDDPYQEIKLTMFVLRWV